MTKRALGTGASLGEDQLCPCPPNDPGCADCSPVEDSGHQDPGQDPDENEENDDDE
jgi:hypothetical protein